MIGYASRTGTRRNLALLRDHGWRLIVSSEGSWRPEGFRFGIDNGAWTAFQQARPWNEGKFVGLCEELARVPDCDWIVAPDIVTGGLSSLARTEAWLPKLERYGKPVLIAVQDGITPSDVRGLVGPETGVFLGGSTEWKLATMRQWGEFCKEEAACYFHVGRVNSRRRISSCQSARADSFDGTSATRYAVTLAALDGARRQLAIEGT